MSNRDKGLGSEEVRVCILRHGYFPDDVRTRKQAYALAQQGHRVDVICLRRKGQIVREDLQGVRIYRIPMGHSRGSVFWYCCEYAIGFVAMSVLLLLLHARTRYQAVQACTMPDFLVFATLPVKFLGVRVLLDVHEPMPELWITKYGEEQLRLLLRFLRAVELRSIGYADHVFTVTQAMKRQLVAKGADASKMTVVPNVCDEEFEQSARQLEPGSTHSEGDFVLVTHGLVEERYGHSTLVRAVHRLRESLPRLRLDILGDGEYAERLAQLVKELGVEDRIRLMGYVSSECLFHTLAAADVGVVAMQCSPYSELIDTNKMYDYIVFRKPVIASRLRGVEEMFDDSCMMFFEPDNCDELIQRIREAHDDPQRCQRLAQNAYVRFESLRWSLSKKTYTRRVTSLADPMEPVHGVPGIRPSE